MATPDSDTTQDLNHDSVTTELGIDVTNVHKTFVSGERAVHALDGANLTIDEPGFYAIMGPAGESWSHRCTLETFLPPHITSGDAFWVERLLS